MAIRQAHEAHVPCQSSSLFLDFKYCRFFRLLSTSKVAPFAHPLQPSASSSMSRNQGWSRWVRSFERSSRMNTAWALTTGTYPETLTCGSKLDTGYAGANCPRKTWRILAERFAVCTYGLVILSCMTLFLHCAFCFFLPEQFASADSTMTLQFCSQHESAAAGGLSFYLDLHVGPPTSFDDTFYMPPGFSFTCGKLMPRT